MPKRRFRRKNVRARRSRQGVVGSGNQEVGTRQKVVAASGTDDFATVGVTFQSGSLSPEPGVLVSTVTNGVVGDLTGVAGTYMPVAPGTLGERLRRLGDCYSEYRVCRILVKHRPLVNTVNTQTTITKNNTFGNFSFSPDFTAVVGWTQDPEYTGASLTPTELLNYSAKRVDMSKPWTFNITPRQGWKYQPVPTENISVANTMGDLRTMFTGNFVLLWNDTSNLPVGRAGTSTNALYVKTGSLEIDWEFDFRYPADPDVTGPSVADPVAVVNRLIQRSGRSHPEEEQKKLTSSVLTGENKPGKGWF